MGSFGACVVSAICLSVKVCPWKCGCVFHLTVRQTGVSVSEIVSFVLVVLISELR